MESLDNTKDFRPQFYNILAYSYPIFFKKKNDEEAIKRLSFILADFHNGNITQLCFIDYFISFFDSDKMRAKFLCELIAYYKFLSQDWKHQSAKFCLEYSRNNDVDVATDEAIEAYRKTTIERLTDTCNSVIDYCNQLKTKYETPQAETSSKAEPPETSSKREKLTFFDIRKKTPSLEKIIDEMKEQGFWQDNPDGQSYWKGSSTALNCFADYLRDVFKITKERTFEAALNPETEKRFSNPQNEKKYWNRDEKKKFTAKLDLIFKKVFPDFNPNFPQKTKIY